MLTVEQSALIKLCFGKMFPFVNRNETVETSRRTSHRSKLTSTTPSILPNGRSRVNNEGVIATRLPKRRENKCNWIVEDFTSNGKHETSNRKPEEDVMYSIKRGKRTLNMEKFTSPRSVKVLRRSQAQNATAVPGKASSKIQLPSVKVKK